MHTVDESFALFLHDFWADQRAFLYMFYLIFSHSPKTSMFRPSEEVKIAPRSECESKGARMNRQLTRGV